jgi:hypothetical protein
LLRAATEAVRHVEQRAPEILAPLEKTLQRNAADLAKPIDKALSWQPRERSRRKRQKRKSPQTSSRTGSARKTVASRNKKKSSRARAAARTGARRSKRR